MLSSTSLRFGFFHDSYRGGIIYGVCDTQISFDNPFGVDVYRDGNLHVSKTVIERGDFFENSCCKGPKIPAGYFKEYFQNEE